MRVPVGTCGKTKLPSRPVRVSYFAANPGKRSADDVGDEASPEYNALNVWQISFAPTTGWPSASSTWPGKSAASCKRISQYQRCDSLKRS